EVGAAGTTSPRFAHDSSRTPFQPPPAGAIPTKRATNQSGDDSKQVVVHVPEPMDLPEPQPWPACACGGGCPVCQTEESGDGHEQLPTKHPGSSNSEHSAAPSVVDEVLRSPGEPLEPATRAAW